jgi:hypothetical protein
VRDVFVDYTLELALHLREKHGKSSVKLVEKCPDIPVAVVKYTEEHKTVLVGKSERKWPLEDLIVQRIILKWILNTILGKKEKQSHYRP